MGLGKGKGKRIQHACFPQKMALLRAKANHLGKIDVRNAEQMTKGYGNTYGVSLEDDFILCFDITHT